MTDSAGPTAVIPNKQLAMSRALGAAFLTHQVEQLEKTVSAGPGSRNWRDRDKKPSQTPNHPNQGQYGQRQSKPGELWNPDGNGNGRGTFGRKRGGGAGRRMDGGERDREGESAIERGGGPKILNRNARREEGGLGNRFGEAQTRKIQRKEKDADVVILDASVLINGLWQVKKWCRDGRDEIVIVPLEALNTLDLLKKGTTPLAQRARQASRILEAQVGTNSRIRVQQDNAYVLWDSISLEPAPPSEDDKGIVLGSPEWVRRTISCAKWQVENVDSTIPPPTAAAANKRGLRVVLAVLTQSPTQPLNSAPPGSRPVSANADADSPVPLPAPHVLMHPNKYEIRAQGELVAHWAKRAGVEVMDVSTEGAGPGGGHSAAVGGVAGANLATGAGAGEVEDRGMKTIRGSPPRANHHGPGHGYGHGAGRHQKNSHSQYSGGSDKDRDAVVGFKDAPIGKERERERLVDRPPAVKKMMDMVKEPSVVVRVLARGEKLDP